MSPPPILYSFRRCPYAMRARMALLVSGLPFEIREVALRAKPAEMLAASPKGTVPVLVLPDGSIIDESRDIMRWALSQNDPEHWLAVDDTPLIDRFDDRFKHHLDRYKYPDRHGSDPVAHRAAGLVLLDLLEARLMTGANLCGDAPSLSDIAIVPFVRQFAAVEPASFAIAAPPQVRRWLAAHLAAPLFDRAMRRLRPWVAGDAPVVWLEALYSLADAPQDKRVTEPALPDPATLLDLDISPECLPGVRETLEALAAHWRNLAAFEMPE